MSKIILGLIAFSCLITFALAGGPPPPAPANVTKIQYATYSDNACTQLVSSFNTTSGSCSYGSLWSQSADNAFVYIYSYSTPTCLIANITSVSKMQAGVCGALVGTGSSFIQLTIFTSTVNPAPPTPFPPQGFLTTTQYINPNTSQPDNTCSSARTVVSAVPPPPSSGPCQKYSSSGLLSFQFFQDSTCSTQVSAFYSDPTCTNIVRVLSKTVQFKSCDGGIPRTCTGTGIPSFPSTLSIGYSQYDNNQCITNSKTQQTVASNGGCFNYQSLTCGMVNGTQMLTANSFKNANCTGGITNTVYVHTGICSLDVNAPNVTATCNAQPIGPSPISSSSTGTVRSSTGSSGGDNGTSSSTGADSHSSVDLSHSVSTGSILIGMIVGFMTIKMSN